MSPKFIVGYGDMRQVFASVFCQLPTLAKTQVRLPLLFSRQNLSTKVGFVCDRACHVLYIL